MVVGTSASSKTMNTILDALNISAYFKYRLCSNDVNSRKPARSEIVEKLKSLGFKFVTIDLQGFRSGSLNELFAENERTKRL